MTDRKKVDLLWHQWQAAGRPFENFRRRDAPAPTYKVECDLDHQADYIVVLHEAWQDSNPKWDVPMRASNELADLDEFEQQLAALDLPISETLALCDYMVATRELLTAIHDSVSGQIG
ncbi:MAG TPA: hypothetical protein VH559_13210 [Gemmatimonadaceae bacterium]|jgi:hypothetical protein